MACSNIPLIYIAGPFTAPTHWQIVQNVRDAEDLALRVAHLRGFPVCPHKNTENFHGLLTAAFWYDGTMALLRRCDAVVTTARWKDNPGAIREVAEAKLLHKPVFHGVWRTRHPGNTQLAAWIENFCKEETACPILNR